MAEPEKITPDDGAGGLTTGSKTDFLNYFGKDRWIHLWLAEKRTRLVAVVFPPLVRLGLVPDTISYIGICLLVGVILYFVRDPQIAVLFLAGHVVCDGLDGAYARYTGKASQSGAFTDLVCDQLGMIVVAVLAVFHHLVGPLLGAVYVILYLIVVVFGVIINFMGLGTRITITSKYFLYSVFAVWAFAEVNLIPPMMWVFSAIMAIEVIIGYLRLKRGIRKKFDAAVRFTGGDPYSSKLNYVLNVAVPIIVLLVIAVAANTVPIRAMLERPSRAVQWHEGPSVAEGAEQENIIGVGARTGSFLLLTRDSSGTISLREVPARGGMPAGRFTLPGYFDPAFTSLPVDGNLLLVADRTTHLLMGIDLAASFTAGRAVIDLTLPLGHLRVTAMTVGLRNGKKVWLAANYLYTRRTYVVNPEKALKKGHLLGGVETSYINGGFPSGLTSVDGVVIDFNRAPFKSLLYSVPLCKVTARENLLEAKTTSFAPPANDCIGPVAQGDDIVMLSSEGRVFRLAIQSFLR
jgi:phosphatidylglycerophosphate synthase